MEHADDDDLDEMSCVGESEEQRLMKQLKEQEAMQKLIQDEMDTQSLATTIPPCPSQVCANFLVFFLIL